MKNKDAMQRTRKSTVYTRNFETVGYKVYLKPNYKQIEIFNEYFGLVRFVYNKGIELYENYLETNKKRPSFYTLDGLFTKLKYKSGYEWLQNYSSYTIKTVLKDLIRSYSFYLNPELDKGEPNKKYKKNSHQSFPIRKTNLAIFDNYIQIPSIGNIYVDEIRPEIKGYGNTTITTTTNKYKGLRYIEYVDPRIKFDGYHYYLAFSIKVNAKNDNVVNSYRKYGGNREWLNRKFGDVIGIDVGCKGDNWIVDSRGHRVTLPSQELEDRKIVGLSKQLSRQLRSSDYAKTKLESKNQQKTKKRINKYYKKITNKKEEKIHEYCISLLEDKPELVVMETIYVSKMITPRNSDISSKLRRRINKKIYDAMLYRMMEIIDKTMVSNGIEIIYSPENYASTKICNSCGNKYNIGKSRIYNCPHCGMVIDRDLNASINEKLYGIKYLSISECA